MKLVELYRGILIVSLLAAAGSGAQISAIIIRHDRDAAKHVALAEQFPAVGQVMPDGGCTLIGSRWVLTAAHVAAHVYVHGWASTGQFVA